MRITIFGGGSLDGPDPIDRLAVDLAEARDQGFDTYWVPQIFGPDALTALAVAARDVPGIDVGTAVVPTYPRHPMALAAQALTVSSALGGRVRLGIGLSHQIVVEGMWGISFARSATHMSEYLDALVPLLHGEAVSVSGDLVTARGALGVQAPAPQVLVAALGPRMLEITGQKADGTVTWMVGPQTLADHTGPVLRAAAAAAGRPEPQVVAGFPMCVTDDVAAARATAAEVFAIYGQLPSYRAMLDREGLAGPEDLALIGDEAAVAAGIEAVAASGATELSAAAFGNPEEQARTRALLQQLNTGR